MSNSHEEQHAPIDAQDFTRASSAVEAMIAAVRADQWDGATPCEEWTVRQLVDHLIEVNQTFTTCLGGSIADGAEDPVAAYRLSAQALSAALALPGVLYQTYPGPFTQATGTHQLQVRMADLLTHGWDLGRATGICADLPVDLTESAISFVRKRAEGFARSGKYRSPQPVAADAPALDRLAAITGRAIG